MNPYRGGLNYGEDELKMDHSTLELAGGMSAKFDAKLMGYTTSMEYKDHKVDLVLFGFEGNPDTREALKYTFANLMKDFEGYEKKALQGLCDRIGTVVNKDSDEKITIDDMRKEYFLSMVTLIDDDRVGVIAKANTGVEFMYEVRDPDDGDSQLQTLAAEGTLEDGFDMFYLNGMPILDSSIYKPHELSTGDIANYSSGVETYVCDVEFLDYEVECYFELDRDESGAEKAFDLFERILKKAHVFDSQAKDLLMASLIKNIDDIRETLGLPDLTPEEIREEMMLDVAVFGSESDMEFAYFFAGEKKLLKATAMGTYTMGFNQYMLEYMDDDEF